MHERAIQRVALFIVAAISAAAFVLPLRSPAQSALATESFDSSLGSLNNTDDGSGWAAAWQVQNGSTTVPGYNTAGSAPLSYAGISSGGGYAIGGDGWQWAGRLLDTSPGGPFAPYLANGLIGAPGTTLTFGVLMRKDVDTEDEMSVTLHSGNPPWWVNKPGIAIGHFGAPSDTAGIRYWSLRLDGVVHQTSTSVVVGQPAFLVLKITFGATSAVSLYVNPSSETLSATPDAQSTTSNPIAFQSVAFNGGSGANQSSIDEIRLAASYGALVAGTSPAPAPPAFVSAVPGDQTIALSWAAVSGVTDYLVYQSVAETTQLEATVASNIFLDAGLINGTAYTYYVVASGVTGSSVSSMQVTAVPHGPAPAPRPALGINLTAVADYSRAWPFVDAFKSARPWIAQQQGAPWGQGPPLQLDSHGWITSLQPGQYAETIMYDNAQDDEANYPVGQYALLYDGSGTLSFDVQSATIVSQTPGRMVVDVRAGLPNGIMLIESATDPANPIRNIRFILPGFESTYATQPFHPLFLQRLSNYRVVRFMEWMATNGSTVQNWSDRATPQDYTYSWRGVPLEVMIQLANTLHAKPWFNIPSQANDGYVHQFALVVQQLLNPDLSFYLEYSNETWNRSFSQSTYIEAQGEALGFSTDSTIAGADFTAYRAVEIFQAFQADLGSSGRMIRVIGSQAENSWLSDQTLQFHNAFVNADVLAIAPYFNCSDTATGGFGVLGEPSTADHVAAMSVEQVNAIQLAHINNCVLREMQSNAEVAATYGLKLVAYEGGQSLVGFNGAENNTALTTLFGNVNRDAGMEALYNQYFQNWVGAGGDMFVHYSDMGAYAKYGNFGVLEYQEQDPGTSSKYRALNTFATQHP